MKQSQSLSALYYNEAYQKIKEYSGYDLKTWIDTNAAWATDLNEETVRHFEEQKLLQYLLW